MRLNEWVAWYRRKSGDGAKIPVDRATCMGWGLL